MRGTSSLLSLCLGLALCLSARADDAKPSGPSSAKECAVCHVRWVPTFFAGAGSDYLARPDVSTIGTQIMCFSCHDGSMEDSRSRMLHGDQHELGGKAPAGMVIPDDFPLADDGGLTCVTCHTAHGVTKEQAAQGDTFFMRFSNIDSALCTQCHLDQLGGTDAGSHPLGDPVDPGHPSDDVVTCESCHDVHGAPAEPMLAKSLAVGGVCLDCHKDRGLKGALGLAGGGHPVGVKATTAVPSAELLGEGSKLGPGQTVVCQSCHKVHGASRADGRLLVTTRSGEGLCVQCHEDRLSVTGTPHDLTESRPDIRNTVGQNAAEGGVCAVCHLPHGAARRRETGVPRSMGLCLSCHGSGGVATTERLGGYKHPLEVQAPDGSDVTCGSCHNPHKAVPDGASANAPADFLKQPRASLCLDCHQDQAQIRSTRHDLSDQDKPVTNLNGLSAEDSGPCLVCHEVHGDLPDQRFSRLLANQGTDDVARLCMSCHTDADITGKGSLGDHNHPTGVAPRVFGVDAVLPLQPVPGRRERDAIITCATCHDPHQWSPTGQQDAAPFDSAPDASTSFLRLDNSGDSELCRSCHKPEASMLGTDHDLSQSAPDTQNRLGKTPAQSGPCSACHVPHDSEEPSVLWARDTVRRHAKQAGLDKVTTYCLSCHRKNGPAQAKVPQVMTHPPVDIVDLGEALGGESFPVFDPETGARVRSGRMACPSCHQPHRWSAIRDDQAAATNQEGDATTSFLRARSDKLPCRDCHGEDSIYLYQHFHDPEARAHPVDSLD